MPEKKSASQGYGSEVVVFYRGDEIARYPRVMKRVKHTIVSSITLDSIESRPRSVFNARPVKDNISTRLLALAVGCPVPKRWSNHSGSVLTTVKPKS